MNTKTRFKLTVIAALFLGALLDSGTGGIVIIQIVYLEVDVRFT